MTQAAKVEAVAAVAKAWRDPECSARERAVRATLEAPGRYTEEGLAFALNQRMHTLSEAALKGWLEGREASRQQTVGVVCGDAPPLDGLEAALAALLTGHELLIAPSDASPALVPAFLADIARQASGLRADVVSRSDLLRRADLLVALGSEDDLDALEEEADAVGISKTRRRLHQPGLVVAVIDGREDAEVRSGLAEDLLLHEGLGPRSPSVLWAPAGLGPDAVLDTLAGFRELYPPHPDTDGTFALPVAFLAASGQSHATGPGFLVSKGAPEPQGAGHIRWAEYAALSEVAAWLKARGEAVEFVVASGGVAERLGVEQRVVAPGDAHRPGLGDEVPGLVGFLASQAG